MRYLLVEQGNSVVVIEHNLDVINTAGFILDLGPDGGVRGGEIVAQGTLEEVAHESNLSPMPERVSEASTSQAGGDAVRITAKTFLI